MEENLWEKDLFNNTNILYLFNHEIIEYDMKEAGFSLTKEYKLLPEKTIQKLFKMDKEKRRIEMGLIQRENQEYKESLKNCFIEARKRFIIENDLDINSIISIKKDALFVIKKCNKTKFGDYIEFRKKNEYTSFIRLNKFIELYYNNDELEVKGIRPEVLSDHKPFMISFLKQYFRKMESEPLEKVIDFMKKFITKYKKGKLEVGYYQKFNRNSGYDMLEYGDKYTINPYDTDSSFLDISYNYYEVLIKLIKIPL